MIDTQMLDFFPQIDMTEHNPVKPMDEPGPNSGPNNGLLFRKTVCYTDITDLRMPGLTNQSQVFNKAMK